MRDCPGTGDCADCAKRTANSGGREGEDCPPAFTSLCILQQTLMALTGYVSVLNLISDGSL